MYTGWTATSGAHPPAAPRNPGEQPHHLGGGVGVKVPRRDSEERRDPLGRRDDSFGDEPGVADAVVGVDEDAGAAGALAPARDIADGAQIPRAVQIVLRLGAGRINP